jgi:hypothetical protein
MSLKAPSGGFTTDTINTTTQEMLTRAQDVNEQAASADDSSRQDQSAASALSEIVVELADAPEEEGGEINMNSPVEDDSAANQMSVSEETEAMIVISVSPEDRDLDAGMSALPAESDLSQDQDDLIEGRECTVERIASPQSEHASVIEVNTAAHTDDITVQEHAPTYDIREFIQSQAVDSYVDTTEAPPAYAAEWANARVYAAAEAVALFSLVEGQTINADYSDQAVTDSADILTGERASNNFSQAAAKMPSSEFPSHSSDDAQVTYLTMSEAVQDGPNMLSRSSFPATKPVSVCKGVAIAQSEPSVGVPVEDVGWMTVAETHARPPLLPLSPSRSVGADVTRSDFTQPIAPLVWGDPFIALLPQSVLNSTPLEPSFRLETRAPPPPPRPSTVEALHLHSTLSYTPRESIDAIETRTPPPPPPRPLGHGM